MCAARVCAHAVEKIKLKTSACSSAAPLKLTFAECQHMSVDSVVQSQLAHAGGAAWFAVALDGHSGECGGQQGQGRGDESGTWGEAEWGAFLRCAYDREPSDAEQELFRQLAAASTAREGGTAAPGDVAMRIDAFRDWLTNLVLQGKSAVVWHFLRACGGYDGHLRIVCAPWGDERE